MTRAPLLLAAPSAWRQGSCTRARVLLALLAVLAIAAAAMGAPPGDDGRVGFALDTGLIEGVRHGGDYYGVAADLVRSSDAAARPLVGVRLPTLTMIVATWPRAIVPALLAALALAVALAWYGRLAPALSRTGARIAAAVLLLAGVGAALRPDAALAAETWASLFVALSLARWQPRRPSEAIGWALAAALVDERAAAAIVVMALFAWAGHARREAAGWTIALLVVGIVVMVHRHAIETAGIVFADNASPAATRIGDTLADLGAATALMALPTSLATAVTALALAGWSAWRDALGPRLLAVAAAFLTLGAVSALGSATALLAAPAALAGLVFLPDGLCDLATAALDRRRVTVRRVAR